MKIIGDCSCCGEKAELQRFYYSSDDYELYCKECVVSESELIGRV